MPYLGKKPIDHTDVTQSQSMTVTDDLNVGGDLDATTAVFDRASTDGTIVDLQKDNSTVGSIGAFSNSTSYCGASSGIYFNGANINPTTGDPTVRTDNANDIGQASQRFKDLYLGGGVYLGGTGSANHLDDYEEGTWTPTPSAGTISHNSYYTKIGRLVTVHANINTFSDRTSSNNISFTGLPFQVAGNSWASQGIMARFINAGGDSIVAYAQSNSTSLKIYAVLNNANYVHVRHNQLSSTSSNLFVTVSYLTD